MLDRPFHAAERPLAPLEHENVEDPGADGEAGQRDAERLEDLSGGDA